MLGTVGRPVSPQRFHLIAHDRDAQTVFIEDQNSGLRAVCVTVCRGVRRFYTNSRYKPPWNGARGLP